jgi:hypothetical protein
MAVAAVAFVLAVDFGASADGTAPAMRVRLELADGGAIDGSLGPIAGDAITIDTAEGPRSVPVTDVRRVVRVDPPPPPDGRVRVESVDGTVVSGDDFVWEEAGAAVLRGTTRIELPIARVRRVEFAAAPADRPAWLASIPDAPTEDLVVVAKNESHEVVECAITAVSPESVTVVLDGETIPVRRAKVRGLVWSRPRAATSGARVAFSGGTFVAATVATSGDTLVIDDGVRLPVGLLESIDFAAGRSAALCDLKPARVATEPFVGDLTRIEGVASFFAPRTVSLPTVESGQPGGERAIQVRPRTVASWEVPAAARSFRAVVVRSAEARPQAAVRVAIRGDDRPAREVVVDATTPEGVAVELDVADTRRLEVLVDFVGDDPGCAVRLERAVFER